MVQDKFQDPVVSMGTTFDIGGTKARVTGITRKGVKCIVEGRNTDFLIEFRQIENALEQAKKNE